METSQCRISLADLSAAGIRLHPSEAAAITCDVVRRVENGQLPGVPAAAVMRLAGDGTIAADGPVDPGQSIERAGRLLDAMLPGFDAPPEVRTPGALRIVVARALRTLDLPPYRSVDEFVQAVARFAHADTAAVVRSLCESWTAASQLPKDAPLPASLTISDIRRARRSTGLTLSEVAERSHIPVSLLRELEWGYFPNWPCDQYGRSQLVRYARAAGLDEHVVVQTVWPMVQHATIAGIPRVVEAALVEDDPVTIRESLVRSEPAPMVVRSEKRSKTRGAALAAAAIAALLTIGFVPALWHSAQDPEPSVDAAVNTSTADRAPRAAAPAPDVEEPAPQKRAARQVASPTPAQPAALRGNVAFSPAFASTGTAMFYHSAAVGDSAIMRADTDASGEVLRITSVVNDDAQNFHARPSPDGRLIAFDSDRQGERAVYVADVDGRNVHRVSGSGFAAVPSWSPDGRRLAFVRAEPQHPRVWNLWTVDLDTGDSRRLTSHRVGQPWGAAWFPDGERIAYSHEDRLVVRSLDGTFQRIYQSPRKGRLLRTPAVSPDGRRVMFQVYRDGGWLLDLADGSMVRVLTDPTAEEFSWSPDGRRVAYHSRKSGTWGVWVMAPR